MDHRENLIAVWNQATDLDKETAIASYWKYQKITFNIAWKYGFAGPIGAAVFAALSPNNDYWGNLRDTDTLLKAAFEKRYLDTVSVSTYGNNKRKAWRIAHGEKPEDLITGLKTCNFYHNIVDPEDPRWVTIDGHMFNIWFGKRAPIQSKNPSVRVVKVSQKLYPIIADGIKAFAAEKGLVPCQMQGVLWGVWRKIHSIRTPAQREMWDRDYLEARLGFVCM